MDLCWKKVAERMEEEVLDKYRVEGSKKGPTKEGMEKSAKKQETQNKEVERRLLGETFLLVQRIQFAATAKQARGANRRGGYEAAAKDGHHERSDKEY